tara:strand:- start:225 stop:908 length:684 start_codon:yes stop_codon:yes gene_type:complete
MSQSELVYELMKEHADRMDLSGFHPASDEYRRKMNRTYEIFSEAFKMSAEDKYPGVYAECLYDERGICEFVLTADGMTDAYKSTVALFKAKPDTFPYPVTLFRQGNGDSSLEAKIIDRNGKQVNVKEWDQLGITISRALDGLLRCTFFYEGSSAYRFIAINAPSILTNIIGEYSMMMILDGVAIEPMPKEDNEKIEIKMLSEIKEAFEYICWKQGMDPYPSPHLTTH